MTASVIGSASARRSVADAFDRDQRLAVVLNDAQQRLVTANEQLWTELRPEGLAAIYGDLPQFETIQLEAAAESGSAVLASRDPLGEIQRVHWEIHCAHFAYQHAAEDRRQLAADTGELIARRVAALEATGWTEQDAREANVHDLAHHA